MNKILIALISLVVGVIAGAILGGSVLGGAMMGAGASVGLSSGICSTVKAAQDEGIMTAEQVDQVMKRAAQNLMATSGVAATEEIVGTAAACEAVLARLREARGT